MRASLGFGINNRPEGIERPRQGKGLFGRNLTNNLVGCLIDDRDHGSTTEIIDPKLEIPRGLAGLLLEALRCAGDVCKFNWRRRRQGLATGRLVVAGRARYAAASRSVRNQFRVVVALPSVQVLGVTVGKLPHHHDCQPSVPFHR